MECPDSRPSPQSQFSETRITYTRPITHYYVRNSNGLIYLVFVAPLYFAFLLLSDKIFSMRELISYQSNSQNEWYVSTTKPSPYFLEFHRGPLTDPPSDYTSQFVRHSP